MLTLSKQHSINEYFDREILADTKHEYINGEIIAMTGGTPTHNTIAANLLVILHSALRQQPYRVFVTDQRLWIPELQIATYPDIMVTPEPPQLMEGRKDTIVNPVFMAEVLSDSTAEYDRTEKFAYYRTIETFQEYLLVSQHKMYLEHFYKETDRWIFNAYKEETMINLSSLQIQVPTSEIYQRIQF
jgi:Uma2 family endonuclease